MEKRHHAASMASLRRSMQRSFEDLWKPSMVVSPPPTAACCSFYCHDSPRLSRNNIITLSKWTAGGGAYCATEWDRGGAGRERD